MKIWFQNRRAKWKRVKAGIAGPGGAIGPSAGGSHAPGATSAGGSSKIVVPIPVHVSRQFAMRNQNYGGGDNSATASTSHVDGEKAVLRAPQPNGTPLRANVDEDYKSPFTQVK